MEIQEDFVGTHFHGYYSQNSLTFHYLSVDPLQVLTREGLGFFGCNVIRQGFGHHIHPDTRIVKGFLWYGIPNRTEENSGSAVDLDDTTIGLCFLCPFLADDHRKTLYL